MTPQLIELAAGQPSFGPGGDRYLKKLTAGDTAGLFSLTQIDVQPGGGPPLHRHTREDELFTILEGEVTFWIDGSVLVAKAGDVAWAPRNFAHTFRNRGARPARMLVLVTPPGVDEFFRRMGEPLPGSDGPPPDDVIAERIQRLGPQYGIEILGPSPL